MSENQYGSIEKAVTGDYEFSIFAAIGEAWAKTKGAKWTFQVAFFYYFIVLIGLVLIAMGATMLLMTPAEDDPLNIIISIALQLAQTLLIMPIAMGLAMLGIKRSVDAPIAADSIFDYFSKMLSLLGTMILMYILLFIGFMLLVLPGIYLAVAYYMAMPLVVEKGLSPWRALETSRKAITKRWFSVFAFFFLMSLIVIISMIPFGLGAIWTLPMMLIAYGILYRNMFGVEAQTLSPA